MSECDNCKNKKDWPCPNTCGYMGTCDGWEPKPMTNADRIRDRIRSMSDEELAEKLSEIETGVKTYGEGVFSYWLDWLKKEGE